LRLIQKLGDITEIEKKLVEGYMRDYELSVNQLRSGLRKRLFLLTAGTILETNLLVVGIKDERIAYLKKQMRSRNKRMAYP